MENVNANMLRSIFFGKSKKPNVLSPKSLKQDILDFNEIMQDQRNAKINIVSEPGQKDSGRREPSIAKVLTEQVGGMEGATRDSYDQAFKVLQELDRPKDQLPNDMLSMAKESVRTMQKVTYVQYLLNTGHARLHVAMKMAHLVSEGVRTLYRQQG